jgi:hypothetical protein
MGPAALERHAVKTATKFLGLVFGSIAVLRAADPMPMPEGNPAPTVLMVGGAPGESEYQPDIKEQMESWQAASKEAQAKFLAIGFEPAGEKDDYTRLKEALASEPKTGSAELWIVLAGHGTFDGKEAKLNLRGPDVSGTELNEWLKDFKRPIAILDTTSSSAPFLGKLAGPNRVIVTSTRSGYEMNYSRFGKYLGEALRDMKSDLDKDGQISLLEAFLSAAHRTVEWYKTEGRLATEHALVDDNGDGLGTPAEWFNGIRAVKKAENSAPVDGQRAHQFHLVRSLAEQQLPPQARARRDALEQEISKLRDQKGKMPEDAYYRALEEKLLELAALYEQS